MTTATTEPLRLAARVLAQIASLDPNRALQLFRTEQKRRPELDDLVWHRELFDQSVQYAIILRDDDGALLSVSRSDGGLPWPLRGVHRWSEADVVRVDGKTMAVEEAVAFLDIDDHRSKVAQSLVESLLIQAELDQHDVHIDAQALQAELDAFRRARGLAAAEATHKWLAENGITQRELERRLHDRLAVNAVRKRVISETSVREEFERVRTGFDEVALTTVWRPTLRQARRTLSDLGRGQVRVDELQSVGDRGAPSSPDLGIRVRRRRREIAPPLKSAFDCEPGALVGPFPLLGGYAVGLVHHVRRARLTADVRAEIEQRLFQTWLDARRAAARIEWMWGRAAP